MPPKRGLNSHGKGKRDTKPYAKNIHAARKSGSKIEHSSKERQSTYKGKGPIKKGGHPDKKGRPTKGRPVQRTPPSRTSTPIKKSDRVANVDIHEAAKVSSEIRADINKFRERQNKTRLFDDNLNLIFSFITPTFIAQHLPHDVMSFRSYLSRFQKGNPNQIEAFLHWYEWSQYELNKGKSFAKPHGKSDQGEKDDEEDMESSAAATKSSAQSSLALKVKERTHVTSILNMCLRHNSAKRREGLHAMVNYFNKMIDDSTDTDSYEAFKATVHHSVSYALTRVVLGMAVEDISHIVLLCDVLYNLLLKTRISSSLVLALVDEELSLTSRMKAVKSRLSAKNGVPNDDEDDAIDLDDIHDPTRGERNQRLNAALFALCVIVSAKKEINLENVNKLSCFLSFCYVEQKALRVLAANTSFLLWKLHESILNATEPMEWCTFAFFNYPKLEYFRPEGIQCLLRFMNLTSEPKHLPHVLKEYIKLDPLKPAVMEQLANALFRKEQVTLVHPMVHPVWDDLLNLIQKRCAEGESLQEHLSTFIHTVIAPYRRGNSDVPRRSLFQQLITKLGQIAVQSSDYAERNEVIQMANKAVGYGKRIVAKPSTLADLKSLPVAALEEKAADLIMQYKSIKDSDPAAHGNRNWILHELRNTLLVPVRDGVKCGYVNTSCLFFLRQGFFPSQKSSRDTRMMNKCIYLFAEFFSFTLKGDLMRPKCTVDPLTIIATYLDAEQNQSTRYNTALNQKKFKKARNAIVEALEKSATRSVLFYENQDMKILFVLLFLVASVDDPSNKDAMLLASSVIPDLVYFYLNGTLESLDMFYDILMALISRKTSPLQVLPLMTCVKRIAVGYMQRFARFIREEETLNLMLSPLKESFNTDSRERARLRKMKKGDSELSDDSEGEAEDDEGKDHEEDEEEQDESEDENTDGENSSEETDDDSSTEEDEDDKETQQNDVDVNENEEFDEEDEDVFNEEEPPTQASIDALKGMVDNIDLDHAYPVDTSNKEKSDVMRLINVVTRVGLQMSSPLVVHIFQVLLAICREEVKSSDDVVFNGAVSAIESLLLSKRRYFGYFVSATNLFQLLGDIQSYCRKSAFYLFKGSSVTSKRFAVSRQRLNKLKTLALRVFHYTALLSFKNDASEEVRITLAEYYKSIFCDRGWEMKRLLGSIKKDLYHYRQGFAWVLLPAAYEKFKDVEALDGRLRFRVFEGCCTLTESMLPRISGLPSQVKKEIQTSICNFMQSISVKQVYEMKHTLPYAYLHTIKHILLYNKRVHLDVDFVSKAVIDACVDDDSLELSSASIRLLSTMERMLQKVPRAKETKTPTPVKVLHSQFIKADEGSKKNRKRGRTTKVRGKILKALLAYRNDDSTDEERAAKRRRREELKIEDKLQRQSLKEQQKAILTKEEREEKRKQIMIAKQQRIAKNRERKRKLFHVRQKSFQRWRQEKLAAAVSSEN